MEYDIDGGNFARKGQAAFDQDGIAWVSGQGGTRGQTDPLHSETAFLLEVAGVTPNVQDAGTGWFLV